MTSNRKSTRVDNARTMASFVQRRTFLQCAAVGAAASLVAPCPILGKALSAKLQIEEPFHGAVLNHRHGDAVEEGLKIWVRGTAPQDAKVIVNGVPAARSHTQFEAHVVLREKEPEIVAVADTGGQTVEDRIRVVWDRNSFPRYRFSIDDNSFFLRDITQKKYQSLFDCFYLDALRNLHNKYGRSLFSISTIQLATIGS